MSVLFKPTDKQQQFIDACFSGTYKFLFYGGAAGGGKTYVGLAILILLCKFFPHSKWHVIRKDKTKLVLNTIPIFHRLVPKRFLIKFVGEVAYFANGSQIHFIGEGYDRDKDLTWMDGLETNGFLFEEVQELHKKTFDKSGLRAGRNILPDMPPILVICTGNPSQNWSKDVFVEPHTAGILKPPYFFLQSLMTDNPNLPSQYVEGLNTLDSITYQRYVLGNWDILDVDKPFVYGWSDKRHIRELKKPLKGIPIYLSFDFNVDPITCIVAQHNGMNGDKGWIRIHKEYRMKDSNIYALCAAIKEDHKGYYPYVTGDASGSSRSAMTRENLNYYKIIMQELQLGHGQMKVPSVNPIISNNRVLVNSIMERYPNLHFHHECKYLIDDCRYVEVNGYGDIDKTKDKHRTHLLDCLRYYLNTFHSGFLKYKL
jgi:phage terminase large subunit